MTKNVEFSYEIGRLEFFPWLNKKAYNIFSDLCRSISIENVDDVIFICSGKFSTGVVSAVSYLMWIARLSYESFYSM